MKRNQNWQSKNGLSCSIQMWMPSLILLLSIATSYCMNKFLYFISISNERLKDKGMQHPPPNGSMCISHIHAHTSGWFSTIAQHRYGGEIIFLNTHTQNSFTKPHHHDVDVNHALDSLCAPHSKYRDKNSRCIRDENVASYGMINSFHSFFCVYLLPFEAIKRKKKTKYSCYEMHHVVRVDVNILCA